MLPTALIPVRLSRTAKGRLAHVLGAEARMLLVRELFAHVVSVVSDAGLRIVVITPQDLEAPPDVEVWRDEGAGLNGSVAAALERLDLPVFVVHADLPRLAAGDIDRALTTDADVVVCRAHDGGTNGLLMRRPIAPAFGPDSALVHAARARAGGLRAAVIDIPGFALDVDDERTLTAAGGAYVRASRP